MAMDNPPAKTMTMTIHLRHNFLHLKKILVCSIVCCRCVTCHHSHSSEPKLLREPRLSLGLQNHCVACRNTVYNTSYGELFPCLIYRMIKPSLNDSAALDPDCADPRRSEALYMRAHGDITQPPNPMTTLPTQAIKTSR
jgi:hypothetical protein